MDAANASINTYNKLKNANDELASDMKMNVSDLNSLLTILEMQGIIRQSAGKMYRALV